MTAAVLQAQQIDFNRYTANQSQYSEEGYEIWEVPEGDNNTKTFDNGVTLTVACDHSLCRHPRDVQLVERRQK